MDYSTVLSSASRLKKNSLYKVTIMESTREILLQLNTQIMSAHDAGLSRTEFKLPINFRRVDDAVTNQELQTAIYFNVVTELEKKEYDVRLSFYKSYTLLKCSWLIKADTDVVKKMHAKLMQLCE
jgi:hypothetical protein